MIYVDQIRNEGQWNPQTTLIINTTSHSKNWSKSLSPFFVKCGHLYRNYSAINVENAWQFSKTYKHLGHLDKNGNPNEKYFEWAVKGWESTFAYRYPAGKGAIPEYSYWDGRKLGYIDARKQIYIPLYSRIISQSIYQELLRRVENAIREGKDVVLLDFDGYNHIKMNMSYQDVLHCETRKMGHGFVLWKLLTDTLK